LGFRCREKTLELPAHVDQHARPVALENERSSFDFDPARNTVTAELLLDTV
jgi:hypothetical protein